MPKSGNHNVNNIDSFFRVRPSKTNIREGETVSFLEDGVLVKQEKRNGVVYEQKFTELASSAKVTQTTGDVTNLIVAGSSSSEGDVTGITAGTGLSGGGSGGNITLNIDSTVTTLTGTQTLTNKTLTAPTLTTPALGTPASGVMTNVTGTAANLTVGNATKITSITNSNIVQLTATQTLTNKTLTSPVIDSVTISTIQTGSESFADNDTSLMTSAAVNDKIGVEVASLVDSAPSTLDTLNELAAALGDDANFSTTVTNSIATKAVLTGSTNNQITTVTGANAIQGEANLTFDGSTLALTGDLNVGIGDFFVDDSTGKTGIGTSSPDTLLHIKHSGSGATSTLKLEDNAREMYLGRDSIKVTTLDGSTSAKLYINSQTSINSALSVTGEGIFLNDNLNLSIGTGQDLRLSHDETDSSISNHNGDLYIMNNADDKDIILKSDDGAGGVTAYLTLDGSGGYMVASKYMIFTDGQKAEFGSSEDLQIYHDGSHSYIDQAGTGNLYIRNTTDDKSIVIQTDDGSGGVTDYMKFKGDENLIRTFKSFRIQDSFELQMGTSADLRIKHDGTNSEIKNYTGAFYITQHLDDGDIILRSDDGSGGVTAYLTLDGSATDIKIAQKMQFPASHSADKIVMYSGGNEKIGTEANTLLFTADNYKFKDTAGHDNLFMNNSGNVGIGTTAPGEKLEISGGKLLVSGGQIRSGSYLEGFPSFSFANDNDTGMFSDTANQLEFSTGGSSRLTIGSTGNLAINQGNRFYLDGVAASGDTYIQSDTADNLRFVVGNRNMIEMIEDDSQDMVVIGNGATDVDFIVEDDAGAAVLTVDSQTSKTTLHSLDVTNNVALGDVTADNVASNSFHYNNSGSLGAEAFTIGASGGVEFTAATAFANSLFESSSGGIISIKNTTGDIDTGTTLGRIDFSASDEDAGSDANLLAASIQALTTADFTASSNQTDLVFYTATSETATEKVRIKHNGRVGIGTDSPTYELDVVGDIGVSHVIYHNDDTNTYAQFTNDRIRLIAGGNTKVDTNETYITAATAPITALNDATANELVTVGSTTTELDAESNLTFDGTTLHIADGALTIDQDDANEGGEIRLLPGNSHSNTYTIDNFYGHLRFFASATAGEQFRLTSDGDLAQLTGTKHYFDGVGHTYITESANDLLDVYVGGTNLLRLEESGTDSVFTTDNVHLAVGTHKDLRIYHNGSSTNNNIENHSGSLYITNEVDDADIILRSDDGSGGVTPYLTLDGSASTTLLSQDTRLNVDNKSLSVGADNDLRMIHDGTSYLQNITATHFIIQNTGLDQDITFKVNDGGSHITALQIDASEIGRVLLPNDNQQLRLGAGQDLQLWHDGSNSYISQTATGDLYIRNMVNDKDIILQSDDGAGGVTAYLTLDGSSGYTKANKHILYLDNVQAFFGTGGDLIIKHDGSNSYISHNVTGNFYIQQNQADKDLVLQSDDGSGGTTAYITLDGSLGYTTVQKHMRFDDAAQLYLGTGADLQIYHDGTNSNIVNLTGDFYLYNHGTADKDFIFVVNDGGSNVTALQIDASDNAKVILPNDSQYLAIGAGQDLRFQHNGTNSFIENYTGALFMDNNVSDSDIYFRVNDGGSTITALRIDASDTGTVRLPNDGQNLYIGQNNDIRLVHLSGTNYMYTYNGPFYLGAVSTDQDVFIRGNDGGASINAVQFDMSDAGSATFNHDVKVNDNGKLKAGSGNDFTIHHDGTNSYINNSTGHIYFTTEADDKNLVFRSDDGSGGVANYLIIDGGSTIITAHKNMKFDDSIKSMYGASSDLQIYHNGTNSYGADNYTGHLIFQQRADDQDIIFKCDDGAGGIATYLTLDGSTTDLLLSPPGNVGIGTASPYERLYVQCEDATSPGIVSNPAATSGAVAYAIGYGDANKDYLNTWGMSYSAAANVFGFGVKPSTTADAEFISSADNANFVRGALYFDNELRFFNAGAGSGYALDSAVSMTERFRVNTSGTGHFDGDVVAYSSTVSDKRLKENITTIDNALDKVMALRGVEYDWTATARKGTHDIGLVAQEVEEIIPELVTEHELCTGEFSGKGNEKIFKTVNYDKIVGVLIEAIKEQQVQIDELKTKIGEQNG